MSPSRTLRIFAFASALLSASLAALSGGCPADSATNPTLPPTVVAGDSAANDGGGDATGGGLTGGSGGGTSSSGGGSTGTGGGAPTISGATGGGGDSGAIRVNELVVAGWMNEPAQAVVLAAAERTAGMTFALAGEPSPSGSAMLFANPGADVTLVYTPVADFVGDAAVTVHVRDGTAEQVDLVVRVRVLPRVEFTLEPYTGDAPLVVAARAEVLGGFELPEDVQLHWNFGDAGEATDLGTTMNRSHTFSNAGTYLVSLALIVGGAANQLGCAHSKPEPARVNVQQRDGAPAANQPPIANAGPDQTVIDSDGNGFALVTLNGGGSSDADGQVVAYTWSVAGGATYGPGPSPQTAVSLAIGTWDITLTVRDDGGATASDMLRVDVVPPAALLVSPGDALSGSGLVGGPFSPSSKLYTLTNGGNAPLAWTAAADAAWVGVSPTGGTLAAGASANVTAAFTNEASTLAAGTYAAKLIFTNTTNGNGNAMRDATLEVIPPGALAVTPGTALAASGLTGGPFTPSSQVYTLTNTGGAAISWTAAKTQSWVTLSSAGGTLAAGASATVTVSINSGANSLAAGSYSDTVTFTNTTNGGGNTTRAVNLSVIAPGGMLVTPGGGLTSSGLVGGPFSPSSQQYTLTNTGGAAINWTATKTRTWVTLSAASGTIAAGGSAVVTVSINAQANTLAAGSYSDTVTFTNTTNGAGNTTRAVSLTVNAPAALSVSPAGGLTSTGLVGGPFSPSSRVYTLTNSGGVSMNWTAAKTQSWVSLSSSGGTLAAGASTNVTVSINSGANSLAAGGYSDTVTFTNTTNGGGNTTRAVSLTVTAPAALSVSGTDLAASGPPGGPFSPASTTYTLSNSGGVSLNWTAGGNQAWLTVSPTSGTLAAGASTTVTASINSNANALAAGIYGASVSFTNATNGAGNATRNATLNVSNVQMASSISQYGITWTFDRPYRVGQFVNGDWWVCPDTPGGTATVTGVTPVPVYGTTDTDQLARNGSCVNPTAMTTNQPYDGRYYSSSGNNYSSAHAVRFPLVLVADSSLVSTVSRPNGDGNRPDLLGTSIGLAKVKLQDAAVLTCLATIPPLDAFRPPYAGTAKPLLRLGDLDLARLPNLAPPNYPNIHTWGLFYAGVYQTSSTPGLAYTRFFQRPWLMHVMGDTGENVRPLNNCPGYYREAHAIESDAALLLCIDGTASSYFGQAGGSKTDLLIAFVQYGIDTYYCIQTNPNPPSRGDRCLSKWPCVFLGLLSGQPQYYSSLNYSNLLFGYQYFKTDACTYSGSGWTNPTYKPLGASWLFRMDPTSGTDNPSNYHYEHIDPFTVGWCGTYPGSNPYWREEDYRRSTHSWTWIGTALAARLLGGVDEWNHPPFFGYCDRWMQESEAAYFSALQAIGNQAPNGPCNDGTYGLLYQQGQLLGLQFVRDMWSLYR